MKYRRVLLLLSLAMFVFTTMNAQDAKYIGATKCKMCHNKADKGEQYNKWAAGPHAKAMDALTGDEKTNPKCLKCHSTAASVDQSLVATIKVEEGVSCESCHGPGSAYKSIPIMKDRAKSVAAGLIIPDETVCKKCHNEESPNYKGFNFDEYFAKIAHPNPLSAK